MNRRLAAAGVAAAALIGAGGWLGYRALGDQPRAVAVQELPDDAVQPVAVEGVETVGAEEPAPVDAGATPMAERVAVLGLLNKRNGLTRDVTLKPGGAVRVGDVVVRLRACERTAPYEAERLTGAFVQLDVLEADRKWRRAFSGWLFGERPALNVVQHPVYDVWTKSCAMAFPDKGPDTVVLDGGASGPRPASGARRSSAPQSPPRGPAPASDAPVSPSSAEPSNAT